MVIEKSIQVNAGAASVWSALQSPELAKMGNGFYVCDWEANSEIIWVANQNGSQFRGKLLQIKDLSYFSYLQYHSTFKHQVTALVSYQLFYLKNQLQVTLVVDLVKVIDEVQIKKQEKWLSHHLQDIADLAVKIKSSEMMFFQSTLQNIN